MEPFLGQIIQVGFTFAPTGWLTCAGQTLPLSQYQALFALLGVNFGGNGQTSFMLPDLQGRVVVGSGSSNSGAGTYVPGEVGGTQNVTLNQQQLPIHTHTAQFTGTGGGGGGGPLQVTVNALQGPAGSNQPSTGALLADAGTGAGTKIYAPAGTLGTQVALGGVTASGGGGGITGGTVAVAPAGSSLPVSILQPYLSVLNIIATQGVYPSRP
ncbi:MAG: tail fiber protein [Caulobacteraceae bacterium]